jgi:hypothetical protein
VLQRTLDQIDAHAIPDNHPAVSRLHDLFGDHTFFLDRNGLNIVEPAEEEQAGARAGQVVNLANWKDEAQTSLEAHEPEPTDVFVELEADEGGGDGPLDGSPMKF